MLFSVRPWTGKYLLLKMNISNVSISVARTSYYTERINASGSHEYAFVIGLPVDASQTSAIELLFDINRSFVYTNGSLEFSPVVEVRSIDHVQYIRATDTVQLTNGTLELAEEARFNQSGASAWTVLGGANAICTQTCVQLCPDRSSPDCHYHCASSCSKEPDYTRTMCDGGVAFNTCAPSKPFRCLNGTYIADCATCGCDENQECNSNGVCGTTAQIGTDVP